VSRCQERRLIIHRAKEGFEILNDVLCSIVIKCYGLGLVLPVVDADRKPVIQDKTHKVSS